MTARAGWVGLAVVLAGCPGGGGGGDGGADGGAPPCEPGAPVDVLFVMQASASAAAMAYEVGRGGERFARRVLTGDLDDDSHPDLTPAASLRVGVVTSVMGIGRATEIRRACDYWGDDARLVRGPTWWPECDPSSISPWDDLTVVEEAADYSSRLFCRLYRGQGRCVAYPLEAMLKAITPSASPIRFRDGTAGHADGENAGFLRDDALWVIVIVGTREDCSAVRELEAWASFDEPACDRDHWFCCDEWLHPIERYVDGLASLRPDGLRRIAVVSWVSTPSLSLPDDVAQEDIPWDALLREPREPFEDCLRTGNVQYSPRLGRFTRAMGRNGLVRGACGADPSEQLASLAGFILERACRP